MSYPHWSTNGGFPVVSSPPPSMRRFATAIRSRLRWPFPPSERRPWLDLRLRNQHGETVWASQQATVCVDMDTMEKQPFPMTYDRV